MSIINEISSKPDPVEMDRIFDDSLEHIHNRVKTLITPTTVLFTTNVDDDTIWDTYISTIDKYHGPDIAQHFNCHLCRSMIKKLGNVVIVNDNGDLVPVMWVKGLGGTPLADTHNAVHDLVAKSKVVSLWMSDQSRVGTRSNMSKAGIEWTHLYVDLPSHVVATNNSIKTASQVMADSKERFRTLFNNDTGIYKINLITFKTALSLLAANELNRSEQFVAAVRFHISIKEATTNKLGNRGSLWRDLMNSPPGWENVNRW